MSTATIDDAKRLCRQLEIKLIGTAERTGPMRTIAVNTIRALLADHGQDHVVVVLRAITEGHEVNRTMLREDVIKAVSDIVRAHPAWVNLGGRWLEAWDHIDLAKIRTAANLSRIGRLRDAISALLYAKLESTLGSSKLPKPPARTKAQVMSDRLALGIGLLKLKTDEPERFAALAYETFKVDPKGNLARQTMVAARLYGNRHDVTSRVSWNALRALSAPTLPAAVRRKFEAAIVAGQAVREPHIRRARLAHAAQARSAGAADGGIIALRN